MYTCGTSSVRLSGSSSVIVTQPGGAQEAVPDLITHQNHPDEL